MATARSQPSAPTIKPFQRTLAAGEIAPWLQTRGDSGKYAFAALLMRNVQVGKWGGAFNRPGLEFVHEVAASDKTTRLLPWVFDDDDRYALELGDGTLRFHQAGATVTAGTVAAHDTTVNYAIGDLASAGGVNYYCITPHINQTPPAATYWYAMPADGTFELPTDFDEDQLFTTRYAQSFDFMWLANREFAPHVLKRFGHTDWTLGVENFTPTMPAPFGGATSGTAASGGSKDFRYKVVAVKKGDNPIESLPCDMAGYVFGPLTGGGGSNIRVTTTVAHNISNGDALYVIDAYPTTGVVDEAFEAALEAQGGILVYTATAVAALHFDIATTTGLTVPAGYAAIVLSLPAVGTTNVDTGPRYIDFGTTDHGPEADCLVTTTGAHGLASGDWLTVLICIPGGAGGDDNGARAALVNHQFRVTVQSSTTFTLDDTHGINWNNSTSGIIFTRAEIRTIVGSGTIGPGNTLILTWFPVPDAAHYWIFKRDASGAFGYFAQVDVPTFTDDGTPSDSTIDATDGPSYPLNPFRGAGNYPQAVGLYSGRLFFGGSDNEPSKWRCSRANDLLNFTVHTPLEADDAIGWTLSFSDVRDVRHFADIDQMTVMTGGRKIVLEGDGNGTITPTLVNAKPRGGLGGVSHVPPLKIDTDALFVEARQSIVRRFKLDLVAGQKADDLTAYAPHLFQGFTIVDWCWQAIPTPTVWIVRSDGALISMTYVPEQEIIACCRHDTGSGTDFGFESVCCIPEPVEDADGNVVGNEDRVYVVVRRTVNSSSKRYVERFARRQAGDNGYALTDDAIFLDSCLAFDGTADGTTKLTITAPDPPADYSANSTLTITATLVPAGTTIFNSWDVGNRLVITDGVNTRTITITSYSSATVVKGTCTQSIPVGLQNTAVLTWTRYYNKVGGLDHLEGRTAGALADGTTQNEAAVSGGVLTLTLGVTPTYAVIVVAGLPYTSQMRLLPPTSGSPSGVLEDTSKVAGKVTLDITDTISNRTQGLRVGTSEDADLRPLATDPALDESDPATVTTLISGKVTASVGGESSKDAGIFIEMADPLPMMVNGIIPEYAIEEAAR